MPAPKAFGAGIFFLVGRERRGPNIWRRRRGALQGGSASPKTMLVNAPSASLLAAVRAARAVGERLIHLAACEHATQNRPRALSRFSLQTAPCCSCLGTRWRTVSHSHRT